MSEQLVQEPKRTKMVQQPQTSRNVKIKTLRAIQIDGNIVPEGQELLVTEEEAKAFCDLSFEGPYDFQGERTSPSSFKIFRATRV